MNPLPPDVLALMNPRPADFAPVIVDNGRVMSWHGSIQIAGAGIMDVEVGLRPGPNGDVLKDIETLRDAAWHLNELGRVGRADLMAYADRKRHVRARA